MKCLTYAESEAWFASFGVKIIESRHLSFPLRARKERRILITDFQIDAPRLIYFSDELVDWLPGGCKRMLWLSNWETYPVNQTIFFEKVRRGSNEERHIIEAPGHLFESSTHDRRDYESRTANEHEENAIMAGLVLLVVCFNWDGYLVVQDQDDYVMIRDNGIMFCSPNDSKIEEACALANQFGKKFRELRS
jgi:hypothetical protein